MESIVCDSLTGQHMKQVPFSDGRLTTDEIGDLYLNHVKIGGMGDTIKVDWILGEREYSVLDLVGFSRIPIYVPCAHWGSVTVKKVTEGRLSSALRFWFIAPIPAVTLNGETFYYIPDYSQYAISREQNLISVSTRKRIDPYTDVDGYKQYSLLADCGKRLRLSRHRAMLLAFTNRPLDYAKLDINHIDCVPGNDDLDNLEWVTRKENMDHAVECGRVRNSIRILVNDAGKLVEYPSITKASKALKVCRSKFSYEKLKAGEWIRLNEQLWFKASNPEILSKPTTPFKKTVYVKEAFGTKKYKFCTIIEAANWLKIPLATMRKRLSRPTSFYYDSDFQVSYTDSWLKPSRYYGDGMSPVLVKDYSTGIVTKYPSVNACSEQLKLHKDTVLYRMYRLGLKLTPGQLMFQPAENAKPWPEITDLVTASLEFGIKKPLLVRNVFTNNVSEYESATEFANSIGVHTSTVTAWISKYDQRIFKKKYQLKYKQDHSQWSIPVDLEQAIENSVKTKSVFVRNAKTGEVKEYSSAKECARDLKLLTSTLNWRLKSNGLKTYPDGLQYKYKESPTPWL